MVHFQYKSKAHCHFIQTLQLQCGTDNSSSQKSDGDGGVAFISATLTHYFLLINKRQRTRLSSFFSLSTVTVWMNDKWIKSRWGETHVCVFSSHPSNTFSVLPLLLSLFHPVRLTHLLSLSLFLSWLGFHGDRESFWRQVVDSRGHVLAVDFPLPTG